MILNLFISTLNITIVIIIKKSKYQRNEKKIKNITKWRNKRHTNNNNWVNGRFEIIKCKENEKKKSNTTQKSHNNKLFSSV